LESFNVSEGSDESSNAEELRRKLDSVSKRLESLEKIILEHPQYAELAALFRLTKATVDLYETPLKMVPSSTRTEPRLEAEVILTPQTIKIGEELTLTLEMSNIGTAPIFLLGIDGFSPDSFRIVSTPQLYRLRDTYLDLGRKLLDSNVNETFELTLVPLQPGSFSITPRFIYADAVGRQRSYEPEAASITVSEPLLPNRARTGYAELDRALMGGVPQQYAVILESISCDEKDSIVKDFLRTGVEQGEVVLFLAREGSESRSFAERYPSTFFLILCNPQADKIIKKLPNVVKLKGVENLNEINIALTTTLRQLGERGENVRRACIDIVSDVLLQHQVVNTRRWLAGLLPQLKAHAFTTLAVMNPEMHSPEEVYAILGLFDGEIWIYEKDAVGRLLKVKKLVDQKYLNVEFPLWRSGDPGS
jgi:KaiC/GvpD/RAD55 family RecA-like ATPase